ncbi:uncharacterized protein BDV17DRAFT_233947 [Aspergillus undulatus]|uniref:uncharacterized protein n=1 Tax=Aspergillus undulatus TaxID=1810928 RepID=UPI003CCD9F4B
MNTRPFELLAGIITVVAPASFGYFFYTGRAVPVPATMPKHDQRTMALLSSSVSKIPWTNLAASSSTKAKTGWAWSKDLFVGRVMPATSSFMSAWSKADVKNISLESMVFEPMARFSEAQKTGSGSGAGWGWWIAAMLLILIALVVITKVGWARVGEQTRQRVQGKIPVSIKKGRDMAMGKVIWRIIMCRPVQKVFGPVWGSLGILSVLFGPHSVKEMCIEWLRKELGLDGGGQQAAGLDPELKRQLDRMQDDVAELRSTCESLDKRTRDTLKMLDDVEERVKACEGWQRACELRGGFGGPANRTAN